MATANGSLTFTYKRVEDLRIHLDLYPPSPPSSSVSPGSAPVVVYFHGGGLTVGNAKSWFPHWLKDRVIQSGFVFVSAEYRLLPPSTGHQVLEDVQDLFKFLSLELNSHLRVVYSQLQINPDCIAVTGSSAGGLCALLAVMHAQPKPKAVVGLYSMGGQMITSQYIQPKNGVFFRGREVLDPQAYSEWLYPRSLELKQTADSALAYRGPDAPIPGFPANPRMLLVRLYLQLGSFLDYYTGDHAPSISSILREQRTQSSQDDIMSLIPKKHHPLFPQFAVTESWPPVFLTHGSDDSAVLAEESRNLHRLLQEAGVDSVLRIIEGAEHSLDYAPDADKLYGSPGGLFDEIRDFIIQHLRPTEPSD